MVKAIFLDVDGTLLSFRTHRVPASAREALLRARERGVRIFIATGRAAADLEPLAAIPYDGVVALNGAECLLRDGRIIARRTIAREEVEKALRLSDRYGFPLAFEQNEGLFVNRLSPAVEALVRMVSHPLPPQTDLRALYDRCGCLQMCFFCDPATERAVMAELPGLVASRWCDLFADVNAQGTDKSAGLEAFAACFGFSPAETMAFGDGGNDAAMLRRAGIGVAMGNACREALAAADYVTASVDDDGVSRALAHFGVI